MMTIAVTGANGQLGSHFCNVAGDEAIPLTRREMDLTNPDAIRDTLLRLRPAVVLNAAAWTAVDAAEENVDACWQVNAGAVEVMADICNQIDAVLVQISTDYVFGQSDGRHQPWTEDDEPTATSVYARSKLAGEQAAEKCEKHFIVRTCGLYSAAAGEPVRGRNFADTMLSLVLQRDELSIVDDQFCTPTFVPHLVDALRFLMGCDAYGCYHITNTDHTTWLGFARELFRLNGDRIKLNSISTADYGLPAPRPGFSVLDTARYHALGGPAMPSWKVGLAEYLDSQIKKPMVAR